MEVADQPGPLVIDAEPEQAAVIVQAGERRSSRLESLRALAALAVLAAHVFAYAHGWAPVIFSGYLHRAVMAGGYGVQLFFALSGYLLFRAFARRDFGGGHVDLRRYARNRALRILPLYYAVVIVLLVFTEHGGTASQWLRFVFFCEEFSTKTAQTLDGPIWSLVVEVIFYILLPIMAWILARISGRNPGRAIAILLVVGAASGVMHHADPAPSVIWNYSFPSNFYGFVPGMVLALIDVSWAGRRPRRLAGAAGRSDAWVVASLVLWALIPISTTYSWVYLTVPASFLLVGACVLPLDHKTLVRALDWKPLAAVGVASYSLYLWHVPIITELVGHVPAGTGWLLLSVLPLSLLVAAVSYAVVERPALLFRSRWAAEPDPDAGPERLPVYARMRANLPSNGVLIGAAALAAIGFLIRAATIAATSPLHLGSDPTDYDRIARLMASGRGFGPSLLSPSGGPTAFRAPLYPIFLSGVFRLTHDSITAARLVEAALGVATAGLIGAAAYLLWGRAAGWAATALTSVFPPFVVWSTSILSESIYLPLESLALVAVLQARRRRARQAEYCALAGLAAGLGVLARPNGAVLVLGLAVLAIAGLPGRRSGSSWSSFLRATVGSAGVLVLVAGISVLPWLSRDYARFHAFVPVSDIDGYNLAGTFNQQAAASGYPTHYQWRPPVAVPSLASAFLDHNLNEKTLGDALWRSGRQWIDSHPASLPSSYVWNTLRMAQLGGASESKADMEEAGFGSTAALLSMISFWIVAALAVVGLACRRAWRPAALWLSPVLLWLISAPFLGTSRIRAPIDVFLILAAATAAAAGFEFISARRGVRLH